jgi:uncharacterized protein
MSHFVYKLNPPRTTFALDMSPDEAEVMSQHVAYWQSLADRRVAVVFGPVADPAGGWGIAIVEPETQADVEAIRDRDPAVTGGVGQAEIYPMPQAILRA